MATVSKVEPLVDALRGRILTGEFGDGKLPSFRTLGAEYNTTQETMNKVMQALQAEGVLVSQGTKGVFVNNARIRMPGVVIDFTHYLEDEGLKAKSEFIEKPQLIKPSTDIIKRMGLKKGEQVLYRNRRQGTEQSMFRLYEEYFPQSLITEDMLEQIYINPDYNILLAIKDTFKKTIGYTQEEIISRLPTAIEQKQLQIVRTNPIIYAQLKHFTEDKKTIITCNNKILNANRFLLTYDYPVNQWK